LEVSEGSGKISQKRGAGGQFAKRAGTYRNDKKKAVETSWSPVDENLGTKNHRGAG